MQRAARTARRTYPLQQRVVVLLGAQLEHRAAKQVEVDCHLRRACSVHVQINTIALWRARGLAALLVLSLAPPLTCAVYEAEDLVRSKDVQRVVPGPSA